MKPASFGFAVRNLLWNLFSLKSEKEIPMTRIATVNHTYNTTDRSWILVQLLWHSLGPPTKYLGAKSLSDITGATERPNASHVRQAHLKLPRISRQQEKTLKHKKADITIPSSYHPRSTKPIWWRRRELLPVADGNPAMGGVGRWRGLKFNSWHLATLRKAIEGTLRIILLPQETYQV
jgi:hypothetical protein